MTLSLKLNYKKLLKEMRKLKEDSLINGRKRKSSIRHNWVKKCPGVKVCTKCNITKSNEVVNGVPSNVIRLSSGEIYSITGSTPDCKDLSEFYN